MASIKYIKPLVVPPQQDIEKLVLLGKQETDRVLSQPMLFSSENNLAVEQALSTVSNTDIRTVDPEIVFGKIYDSIGFKHINEELFRHLVIARLAFPLSKLKTAEYLYRYQGISVNIDTIYRFLDKLNNKLKPQEEQIAFAHTLTQLGSYFS